MSLAILTPKGRIAAQDQLEAARIVFGGGRFRFQHTRTKGAAKVDGIITENGIVVGFAEIKSRPDLSLETLRGEFKNEWILTASKLDDMSSLSIILGVPGYGMLYLKSEGLVLMIKMTLPSGARCCRYRLEKTETQETCNGGKIIRLNAFIDMSRAKIYHK